MLQTMLRKARRLLRAIRKTFVPKGYTRLINDFNDDVFTKTECDENREEFFRNKDRRKAVIEYELKRDVGVLKEMLSWEAYVDYFT